MAEVDGFLVIKDIMLNEDILALADTTVKIGLGALISFLATYCITKLKNKHEFHKEYFNRRLNTLEFIGENLEGLFNSYSKFISQIRGNIAGMMKDDIDLATYKPSNSVAMPKLDYKLTESLKLGDVAIARLRLLKLEDVAGLVECFISFTDEVRTVIIFEDRLPIESELTKWDDTFEAYKKGINTALSKHYCD